MDPTESDPDKYRVVFENERVRVLEYTDSPGDRTSLHAHPDSVMVTLGSFDRRLVHGAEHRDIHLDAGRVHWLPGQEHRGINVGSTPSHAIFIELKEPPPGRGQPGALGPSAG